MRQPVRPLVQYHPTSCRVVAIDQASPGVPGHSVQPCSNLFSGKPDALETQLGSPPPWAGHPTSPRGAVPYLSVLVASTQSVRYQK